LVSIKRSVSLEPRRCVDSVSFSIGIMTLFTFVLRELCCFSGTPPGRSFAVPGVISPDGSSMQCSVPTSYQYFFTNSSSAVLTVAEVEMSVNNQTYCCVVFFLHHEAAVLNVCNSQVHAQQFHCRIVLELHHAFQCDQAGQSALVAHFPSFAAFAVVVLAVFDGRVEECSSTDW
jgi:hypothetical protein